MIKKEILIKFAEKIKKERNRLNLSQEEFANLTGFHRTYIGMIERGERNITLVNIEKLSNALKINPKELLNFDEDAA